ncbi:hypothetical protein NA57DRAFT_81657 [Rhizodiscina lignyota]|uniref:Glutathione transferase n=1 Tax=Rhizodiscina lignyota TaxID=1504668 RepID=A0A9P4I0Z7_9PEZI|nr:hypothetical protein NA57DRAFT_81657 [Rhizodiscina lignyota]
MQRSISLQSHAQIPPDRPPPHGQAQHSINNASAAHTVLPPGSDTPALPTDVSSIFEQERLRQMLAQLQAYNAYSRQPLNHIPIEQSLSPAQAFSQEHFLLNPFGHVAPVSEFSAPGPPNFGTAQDDILPQQPISNADGDADGHFKSANLAVNPPNLQAWRRKLFDIDEVLVLTQDQYQTYFPHVDNVYSHRSTQKYKNRPFVSHYWDCRLKGRPAGTPKSTDPNKKKRKRVARERDLCDVKIKITEYLPGATREDILQHLSQQPQQEGLQRVNSLLTPQQSRATFGSLPAQWSSSLEPAPIPLTVDGTIATSFYTIQRVNGSGTAGGVMPAEEGDGRHRHTLEESDRVKKNSVMRHVMKDEKDRKKSVSQNGVKEKRTYHKKATGPALETVKLHSQDDVLKLFGSCFCPFVQRVWISLEAKKIAYQYIEVDPYSKPKSLLEINPRGLVPALRHGDWGCYESSVLMEYLEDLNVGNPLLPPDPKSRALCRLWSDHINRHIIPAFYRYLQEQDANKQVDYALELKAEIDKLVEAASPQGPLFLGPDLSFVDVQLAPWMLRLRRVLSPYRGWPQPDPGSRWGRWIEAMENEPSVRATTSTDELYLDSYERYAGKTPCDVAFGHDLQNELLTK